MTRSDPHPASSEHNLRGLHESERNTSLHTNTHGRIFTSEFKAEGTCIRLCVKESVLTRRHTKSLTVTQFSKQLPESALHPAVTGQQIRLCMRMWKEVEDYFRLIRRYDPVRSSTVFLSRWKPFGRVRNRHTSRRSQQNQIQRRDGRKRTVMAQMPSDENSTPSNMKRKPMNSFRDGDRSVTAKERTPKAF